MVEKDVANYQQLIEFVIKNSGVAIIEFHSECLPCKMIQPHLENLKKTYKVPVARVDTEKNEQLTSKFDIHALPTYFLVRKLGGDIEIAQTVVSAHVEKLQRLFQIAIDIKSIKK